MQLGVVFPQTEIGADPGGVRAYAQAVEGLGFEHLLVYDHVLGAYPEGRRPDWRGAYTHQDMFHEPFVLFGYLAAITTRLELVTGIIILPQRQTALVAKQTAEVDVLAEGRLRLGIGIGWNDVEYEALNESFRNRGRRCEEQIAVLRALWTQELVTYEGRWHTIRNAGLNPLPVQRPIPLWFGGGAEPVLRRIARLGDGWFPQLQPDDTGRATVARLRALARAAGRDPGEIGIEPRLSVAQGNEDSWRAELAAWQDIGITHLSLNTMGGGLRSVDDHLAALRRGKAALEDLVTGAGPHPHPPPSGRGRE